MPACSADCSTLHRVVPAVPGAVAPLRRTVVDYAHGAGVPLETLRDLALAVSEVLTNVVVHAYPNGAPTGTMAVTACIDDRELRVTVADEGVGIPPGAPPRFGLGLTIVAEVADRLELAPADGGGTAVRLAFPAQG